MQKASQTIKEGGEAEYFRIEVMLFDFFIVGDSEISPE